jgi:hypothetical protein
VVASFAEKVDAIDDDAFYRFDGKFNWTMSYRF